jgi:hypothetical protein
VTGHAALILQGTLLPAASRISTLHRPWTNSECMPTLWMARHILLQRHVLQHMLQLWRCPVPTSQVCNPDIIALCHQCIDQAVLWQQVKGVFPA